MNPALSVNEIITETRSVMNEGKDYFIKLALRFAPAFLAVKVLGLSVYQFSPVMIYATKLAIVAILIFFSFLWFRGVFNEDDGTRVPTNPMQVFRYSAAAFLSFVVVAFAPILFNELTDFFSVRVIHSYILNVAGDYLSMFLSVVMMYIALRLCFVFSAYAEGKTMSPEDSWRATSQICTPLVYAIVRMTAIFAIFTFAYTRGAYAFYKHFLEIRGHYVFNEMIFFLLISPVALVVYPYLVAVITSAVAVAYRRVGPLAKIAALQ
ncbi:MAG: hypothetical protein HYU57_08435 [Micavibrio aeruginosavorus]|nr:hypothetical protein [Micavibrio aeruginosavorus]